jgi:pyrroline-5-carboxylate reductase
MQYTLGFIGCGNMGGALAKAASKSLQGNQIALCDFDKTKVEKFVQEFGAVAATTQEIAHEARFVVLAVKPQMMENAIAEFAEILRARTDVTIITMAAGLSMAAIRQYIGADLPIIRIMPNTPAMLGLGMILYATDGVSEQEEQDFLAAFAAAGVIDKLAEEKIDAASALSGCGPAFCYLFLQSLADGAVECGLSPDKAQLYAAQTMLGAAQMVLTYGEPIKRKDEVCSPGGTTIEGVKALEKADMHGVAVSAVKASYHRTLELKK